MLILLLALVVIAVLAVLFLASRMSDEFRVERAVRVKAPPGTLFAAINDFHRWGDWSPWEKLDPAMKRTFEGADAGVGAVYSWSGNAKAGAGRMQITDSRPASKIAIRLEFLRPFKAHNQVDFVLRQDGNMTEVRWAMTGPLSFGMKILHVFMNMDSVVGKDFEAGLANLKTIAENA